MQPQDIEQRSDAWFRLRAGSFTSSRAADLMATTKNGPSTSRANLIAQLAVERVTGQPTESYTNAAMQRGNDLEGEAREEFQFETGIIVDVCGYIEHPSISRARVGSSPDGLIGEDGLIEIKCPASMAKHLAALEKGAHAVEYAWQIQHQMWVTGRQWNYAVSYDPRFPDWLKLAITRVKRDEEAIAKLEEETVKAEVEVQRLVEFMMEKRKGVENK